LKKFGIHKNKNRGKIEILNGLLRVKGEIFQKSGSQERGSGLGFNISFSPNNYYYINIFLKIFVNLFLAQGLPPIFIHLSLSRSLAQGMYECIFHSRSFGFQF
jgi:hypothetical protein